MRSLFVVAGVVVACCVGPALGAPDLVYNLTAPGAVVGPPTTSGEIWESFDPDNSTGTGVFTPFVRIQGKGEEQGYNTGGTLEWDTKSGAWTHPLAVAAVPYLEVDGIGYREFLLDADQTGSEGGVFLSIDELVISLEASPNLTGYNNSPPAGFGGPIVYNLDSGGVDRSVLIDGSLFASGSGTGDVRVLIPNASFVGSNNWVYLYALMGTYHPANNGFEEWAIRVGGTPPPPVPAPGAILLGALGVGCVGWLRQRKILGR